MTAVVLRERITMRDDTLPHQIRLVFSYTTSTQAIGVSCTCRSTGRASGAGPFYEPFARRTRWDDPGEPLRIWRQHMTAVTP